MDIARLLFAVSHRGGTGTLASDAPSARVELSRGWVYSITSEPTAEDGGAPHPRAEENLRRLLRRGQPARFIDGAPATGRGRTTPFHPAAVLRNHYEALLAENAGTTLRAKAGSQRLRLQIAPHGSALGSDEKRLVALLSVPRTFAELDEARVALPSRTDKLIAFLHAAAALTCDPDPIHYRALGLPEGAPPNEVRRAYKRLARELHPDLHPAASDEARRDLETRFAAVTVAYKALLDTD